MSWIWEDGNGREGLRLSDTDWGYASLISLSDSDEGEACRGSWSQPDFGEADGDDDVECKCDRNDLPFKKRESAQVSEGSRYYCRGSWEAGVYQRGMDEGGGCCCRCRLSSGRGG